MKRILSVFLAVVMLFSVMAIGVSAEDFKDVTGHWGEEYIDYWTGENAVSGYQDNTFRPDNRITRGEVAQIVVNILKLVAKSTTSPFTDMASGAWYFDPVLACYDSGIIIGFPDKTVRANSPITREQAILIVSRITNLSPDASAAGHFIDGKDAGTWAAGAIGALFNAGVLDGYQTANGPEVHPKAEISRAEFLKLLATVDQAPNIGYRVGSRQGGNTTDQPDVPIVIPAIAASTATTATYYKGTVEIHDKDNQTKKVDTKTISALKETGSTPILADVYKYIVDNRAALQTAFGDGAARAEMDAITAKYVENGNKLTADDIDAFGYNAISYTGDSKDRGFDSFLGSTYKSLGVGTYTFEHTVGANTYVVTLVIETK
ncbi:MAG: S-layer homology domain-containing protein [Oscillospiraceae bacterium]|nr:S-layer homology domain-containing protein [Oscillospiraceae bacterium]